MSTQNLTKLEIAAVLSAVRAVISNSSSELENDHPLKTAAKKLDHNWKVFAK